MTVNFRTGMKKHKISARFECTGCGGSFEQNMTAVVLLVDFEDGSLPELGNVSSLGLELFDTCPGCGEQVGCNELWKPEPGEPEPELMSQGEEIDWNDGTHAPTLIPFH